jgi:hypothetical protein
MPFQKGHPGGPGRPKIGSRLDTMVVFDIKQAARALCPRAIQVLEEAMAHKDIRVRTVAALALIDRGYGKPEQRAEAHVTHKFAVVPEVMAEEEWLARKGQPAPKALPPPAKTNGTSH